MGLINNIDKIHTTKMGIDRIKRNLRLDNVDVVSYLKDMVTDESATIILKGKNYYVTYKSVIITINKFSYTIITAHKLK